MAEAYSLGQRLKRVGKRLGRTPDEILSEHEKWATGHEAERVAFGRFDVGDLVLWWEQWPKIKRRFGIIEERQFADELDDDPKLWVRPIDELPKQPFWDNSLVHPHDEEAELIFDYYAVF